MSFLDHLGLYFVIIALFSLWLTALITKRKDPFWEKIFCFSFIIILFSLFIIPLGVLYALLTKGTFALTSWNSTVTLQEFFMMGIYLSLLFVVLSFFSKPIHLINSYLLQGRPNKYIHIILCLLAYMIIIFFVMNFVFTISVKNIVVPLVLSFIFLALDHYGYYWMKRLEKKEGE